MARHLKRKTVNDLAKKFGWRVTDPVYPDHDHVCLKNDRATRSLHMQLTREAGLTYRFYRSLPRGLRSLYEYMTLYPSRRVQSGVRVVPTLHKEKPWFRLKRQGVTDLGCGIQILREDALPADVAYFEAFARNEMDAGPFRDLLIDHGYLQEPSA